MAQSKKTTIVVDLSIEYTVRQKFQKGDEIVWKEKTFTIGEAYEAYEEQCEEEGKEPIEFAEWYIWNAQYGIKREMALHKDQERIEEGKKPTTVYVTRTEVKGASKKADKIRAEHRAEMARALGVKLHEPKEKKAPTRRTGGADATL